MDAGCTRTDSKNVEDGITEGGINIGFVGYQDLNDDCSETMVYVNLRLDVVR